MKKIIIICLLVIVMTTVVFAEPIDQGYINLIFDKFASYDDDTRLANAELLDVFMSSNVGLEVLYSQIVKNKSAEMASYGISEKNLRKNFDALKTWSVSDRKALVAAGVSDDKSAVTALNAKNSDTSSGSQVIEPIMAKTFAEKMDEKGYFNSEIKIIPELKNKTFKDTSSHWSKEYVEFLVARNIVSGKSETSYAPDDKISKSEIVTMILNLIVVDDSKIPKYDENISDISKGNWYDIYMERAFSIGLIHKNKLGVLEPNHNSSREEVVEILIKTIDALEIPISDELKVHPNGFNDFDVVTESRKEAMAIAINLGFISGKGEGIIDPIGEITRGEIAVVIKKLYIYIMEQL